MVMKQSTIAFVQTQNQKLNEHDIDDVFESFYITIISNIQKSLRKGSVWIIDSVIDHTINISKCNPLDGSSYIELPEELNQRKKVWLTFKILMVMNALNNI